MKQFPGRILLAATLAFSLLLTAESYSTAAPASSGTMTQVMTRQQPNKPAVTVTQVVQWSGKNLRLEETKGKQTQVKILNKGTVYVYRTDANPITVLTRKPTPESQKQPGFIETQIRRANLIKSKAKRIGSEKTGGFSCDVYTYSTTLNDNKKSKLTSKAWINRDPRLPIVVRETTTVSGMGTVTTFIKNARIGTPVPASRFQIPKGAKVVDMADIKVVPRGQPQKKR